VKIQNRSKIQFNQLSLEAMKNIVPKLKSLSLNEESETVPSDINRDNFINAFYSYVFIEFEQL